MDELTHLHDHYVDAINRAVERGDDRAVVTLSDAYFNDAMRIICSAPLPGSK